MQKLKTYFITTCLICFGLNGFAQFNTADEMKEAKEMIAICNSFTFLDLYNSDAAIIPKGYKKIYTSGVFGMDNRYQIYQNKTKAVINLRGSTTKKMSWMENVYSSMIPAQGFIVLQDDTFFYKFATDTAASVHAGYALGLAFLADDVIRNIKSLNYDGIFDITITGHSQGGALAILLRAYLENLPQGKIAATNNFKTYAFAHPKVGNKSFVNAYLKYCRLGSNYSIVNTEDFIPKMPLSYLEQETNSVESIATLFLDKSSPSLKELAMGKLGKMFGNTMSSYTKYTSELLLNNISKEVGAVYMPAYRSEINYAIMGNRIELNGFEYPKILKDPTILKNDSLMKYYKRDQNGVFEDETVYKEEASFFQHKPYNYYAAFLKKFYPEEYNHLKVRVLPENL